MNKSELLTGIFNNYTKWINYSFSQEGEDMILDNLLNFKKEGFYIDIGAYHPFHYSNTMRFYRRGWSGLNIDATPGSMKLFNKFRPRDINIEAGISSTEGEQLYYVFEANALNSFDKNSLDKLKKSGYMPIKKIPVRTFNIMQILEKYVNKNQKIDFLDIDIEGFDEIVISQMDFDVYRPTIIMIENRYRSASDDMILENKGYKLAAFTFRTAIYQYKDK